MKQKQKLWFALLAMMFFGIIVAAHTSKTVSSASVATVSVPDAKTDFNGKCASCHGKDGRAKSLHGKHVHARDLTDASWQSDVSDERLFNSISNGKGKMPVFKKKLSDDQIDALVKYVRQLKR
jgi:mono/diheme cytochrome c family protein